MPTTSFWEFLSWISQIALAVTAIIAAGIAWVQIRAFKLFEILKFIESPHIREARHIVFHEIPKLRDSRWWTKKRFNRIEKAAALVCSSYDILGLLPLGKYIGKFYTHHWAPSIITMYEILQPYLEDRRRTNERAYEGYTRLYNAARCARTHSTGPNNSRQTAASGG